MPAAAAAVEEVVLQPLHPSDTASRLHFTLKHLLPCPDSIAALQAPETGDLLVSGLLRHRLQRLTIPATESGHDRQTLPKPSGRSCCKACMQCSQIILLRLLRTSRPLHNWGVEYYRHNRQTDRPKWHHHRGFSKFGPKFPSTCVGIEASPVWQYFHLEYLVGVYQSWAYLYLKSSKIPRRRRQYLLNHEQPPNPSWSQTPMACRTRQQLPHAGKKASKRARPAAFLGWRSGGWMIKRGASKCS